MLAELFERASWLRARIVEIQERGDVSRESVLMSWRGYEPRGSGEVLVCGVDSGWNYRLYQGFYVYGLKAAAVDEGRRLAGEVVEVDLMAGDPYMAGLTPESFLKLRGECYEHEIATRASGEFDLVLVDGSLRARLFEVSRRSSRPLQTEYMSYVRPLEGRGNVFFVAKYSHDRTLLQGMIGDVYYFNKATVGVGYTEPRQAEVSGVTISSFYARLAPHAPVMHVEVPAQVDEDLPRWLIDALHEKAVRGYPYVLRLAHEVSSLPDRLMELVCEAAGLASLELARGVL